MSEFSQSLHLRTNRADDVVELLVRARVPGVVMPPCPSGWVAAYPPLAPDPFSGRRIDLDRILSLAPTGPLVVWDFAADHGLRVEVFEHGKLAALLDTMWETRRVRRFDRAAFVRLGLLSSRDVSDVAAWLDRFTPDDLVAKRMGLCHHGWMKGDSAWHAFDEGALPGARLVRRDGTLVVGAVSESPREVAPPEGDPSRFSAIADASLQGWIQGGMIELDGSPSASLRTALADLLANQPSQRALETFLLEHEEVVEVFASQDELARVVVAVLRSSRRASEVVPR